MHLGKICPIKIIAEIEFPCGHFWDTPIVSVEETEKMEISQKGRQGNPI